MQNSTPDASSSANSRGWRPHLLGPERRCGISNTQSAAAILSHAVAYLIDEQLAGRRFPLKANREAIQILCQAGEAIAHTERREPGTPPDCCLAPQNPPQSRNLPTLISARSITIVCRIAGQRWCRRTIVPVLSLEIRWTAHLMHFRGFPC